MGHVKRYLPGTPCWTDLATPDPAGAKAFYTALFGWAASDTPMGPDMVYTMLLKDGRRAAALFPMDPGSHGGAPPHWQTYISVADVEAASARAAELGATLVVEPVEVEGAGRMAAIQDPSGAHLQLWQPGQHIGCEVVNEPGALIWNELVTRDVAAARAFYEALFGWQPQVDARGYVSYLNAVGEERVYAGGLFPMPDEYPPHVPSHWIPYFAVADVEAARARVETLGGTAITEVMDISAGRFCVAADPQGAAFYLFENPSGETGPSSDTLA